MIDKIKKLDKKNVIKYFIIFSITLLFCQNFLQMHFSSDTYVLYDLGYMQYPSEYFLLDCRLISTIVCYLGGIFNLPIPVYIIAMDFIGIIFIATSIYLINNILEKIIKPEKNITKVLLIAASFILILNQFTLYANCSSGNRPSFTGAAKAEQANELYEYFCSECEKNEIKVERGIFGADMQVNLINDGPVTIIIEK